MARTGSELVPGSRRVPPPQQQLDPDAHRQVTAEPAGPTVELHGPRRGSAALHKQALVHHLSLHSGGGGVWVPAGDDLVVNL